MSTQTTPITIKASIHAPVSKVWDYFTGPQHVTHWNNASPDWHTPSASNDLRVGGSFVYRMEARDGSFGFDFGGTYTNVKPGEYIAYVMGDGRKVETFFTADGDKTTVTETFDPESQNSIEMQTMGWQAILDNFKKYTEQQ